MDTTEEEEDEEHDEDEEKEKNDRISTQQDNFPFEFSIRLLRLKMMLNNQPVPRLMEPGVRKKGQLNISHIISKTASFCRDPSPPLSKKRFILKLPQTVSSRRIYLCLV